MTVRRIDDLIEIARNAAEEHVDRSAIGKWKLEAMAYLIEHFGRDHHYTQCFEAYVRDTERENLLAGGGLLTAAKEEISKSNRLFGALHRDYGELPGD